VIGEAVERAATLRQKAFDGGGSTYWPQTHHGLALDDRGTLSGKRGGEIVRKVRGIDPGRQHSGKAVLSRVAQRRREPAEGAKTRLGPIGDAAETGLIAPAHHQRIALREQRGGDTVDQPCAFIQRLRLVAAEAARLSAREDGSEKGQSNASVALPSAL
jgi:hypothetical protein